MLSCPEGLVMHPRPLVLGLTLCDYVIVEERTRKMSLIGTFSGLAVSGFPAQPPPFSIFATLTDGYGNGRIEMLVTHMETNDQVYTHRAVLTFPDKVTEVIYHLRLRQCVFPAAGNYQFTLLLDGDWMAQRRLRVYEREIEE
jgi:Family of unknown function (DUF6941)